MHTRWGLVMYLLPLFFSGRFPMRTDFDHSGGYISCYKVYDQRDMEKTMKTLDRLLDHDQWATAQLLAAAGGLTDAQLDQEFDIGHRTLRATLEHMVMNVEGWTVAFTDTEPTNDGSSIPDLAERHLRAYPAFAAAARKIDSDDRMEETFTDSFGQPMTFGGAFLMIILHNEGHRPEAAHILHRLGRPDVPEVDHGLWDFVRRGLAD
jgi:uncharacterized damage-inducible protein DinB